MVNSSKKILIIEDDVFLNELMAKKLIEEGFDVIKAVNGEEGLEMAQQERPDLILLDLILPGMDGFEILEKIKEEPETSAIPVIILSNLGQREDIEKGFDLGADDYLIKAHFTPDEIVERARAPFRKPANA
jgi:DNA-binding response OmpR family regulator